MIEEYWLNISKLYDLPKDVNFLEITDSLLKSDFVSPLIKKHLQASARKIYTFSYISEGLKIKATLSCSRYPENEKTIIYLRGGNNLYGLPHPADDILTYKNYTFITTTLRGGISEGRDEFGGADVNDVKHLIDHLPQLKIPFQRENMILLGASRGAMQMFLFLKRHPSYEALFDRAISFSGLSDLEHLMMYRKDMLKMFQEEFSYDLSQAWIDARNPLEAINHLTLPVFIIHGTKDKKILLEDARRLESKLLKTGKKVYFIEANGGDHLLNNLENRMDVVEKGFVQTVV